MIFKQSRNVVMPYIYSGMSRNECSFSFHIICREIRHLVMSVNFLCSKPSRHVSYHRQRRVGRLIFVLTILSLKKTANSRVSNDPTPKRIYVGDV